MRERSSNIKRKSKRRRKCTRLDNNTSMCKINTGCESTKNKSYSKNESAQESNRESQKELAMIICFPFMFQSSVLALLR